MLLAYKCELCSLSIFKFTAIDKFLELNHGISLSPIEIVTQLVPIITVLMH